MLTPRVLPHVLQVERLLAHLDKSGRFPDELGHNLADPPCDAASGDDDSSQPVGDQGWRLGDQAFKTCWGSTTWAEERKHALIVVAYQLEVAQRATLGQG